MENVKILASIFFAAFSVFLIKTEAQPPQPPLCVSQFSLVNYACASLPYTPFPSPPDGDYNGDDDGGDDDDGDDDGGDDDSNDHDHDGDDNDQGHGDHDHVHEHRHGHKHKHKRHYHESPQERNCCKWLKQLDDECVCDLLVRLPAFLSRPAHSFAVKIDESCNVTYSCGPRVNL